MTALWIVLGIVAVVLLGGVWIYNRLVTLRTRVDNGWSQIDVQLRRRADLIPNLVETVKGYATHERELFEHVTEARARSIGAAGVSEQAAAENQVTAGIRQLLAVVENYPDLKANENFLALQEELVGTESKIAYARQFYNDQVMRLNTLIRLVPLLARGERVRLRGTSLLRDRRTDARARAGGPLLAVYEQIASNKRKTAILFVLAILLLGGVGYALGVITNSGPAGLIIALVVAVAMSVGSYLYGDRIVLASTRAKEVTKEDAPRLHNIIEGLAIAAGIPKPRVWIVPESAPNAFATGRDPEHSHVAVTQGLLDTMNRVELEGVIGHEMAHIQDRDILVGTVVATLVGAAVLLAEFFMRMWWWGGFRGRRGNDSGGGAASAIDLRGRVPPPDPRADLRTADPARRLAEPGVPRRRAGGDAHAIPTRPDLGAAEAPVRADGDALREQRDRPPLAEPALPDRGGAPRGAREAVLHASAARGAHPTPGGDVTFPSRCLGVFGRAADRR